MNKPPVRYCVTCGVYIGRHWKPEECSRCKKQNKGSLVGRALAEDNNVSVSKVDERMKQIKERREQIRYTQDTDIPY